MSLMLEKALAQHCGPVLLNKKPAALFAFPRECRQEVFRISEIAGQGIRAHILRMQNSNDLLLIYRPHLLKEAIEEASVKSILSDLEYPVDNGLEHMVQHLKRRIIESNEFPHEVGLFLGYPLEDVLGFIENKGNDFKLCGQWKVYGNVRRAEEKFEEYHKCKDFLLSYVENGGRLGALLFETVAV